MLLSLMSGFWAQHYVGQCHHPYEWCRVDQELWRQWILTAEEEESLFKEAEKLVLLHQSLIRLTAQRIQQGCNCQEINTLLNQREDSVQ